MTFMKCQFAIVLGSACLFAAAAVPVQADVMLAPDADTLLSNDSNRGPTVNHGSADQWQIRYHPAPRMRMGYVRYDISSIAPEFFGSGTLHGEFTDSGKNGPASGGTWLVYGLNDDAVGNDWDESVVSYSDAAGVNNTAPTGTYAIINSAFLGTISTDGVDRPPYPFWSTTTDLDLTTFLEADTDNLVTFLFVDSIQEGSEYYIKTKENGSSDGMMLHFIPEPSVAMLLLSGMGVLSVVRRRR